MKSLMVHVYLKCVGQNTKMWVFEEIRVISLTSWHMIFALISEGDTFRLETMLI